MTGLTGVRALIAAADATAYTVSMVNATTLARLAATAGILAFRLAADGNSDKPCWLRDASAPTGSVVYALCEQGSVWSTINGGAAWKKSDTGAKERLRAIAFLDANRGFIAGDHGLLMATQDGARTWQAQTLDTKEHLMDITFVGESGWLSGYQGALLHSTDAGRTWAKQKSGTTQTIEALFFLDANHGWAVGWAGTILRTADGGAHWEPIHTDAASWSLTAVYFRDLQNGWITGFAGQILRTKDGGTTWQAVESPVKAWLTSVNFDQANRGWITFDDGFLMSEDGGSNWKAVPMPGNYFLSRLLRVQKSLWAIGQSVVLQQADGAKWTPMESLVPSNATGTSGQSGAAKPTVP